ncbi:MAG: hypothetical protein GY841_03020 [FCB group bacterium]|nr:hypothetical protein [FCB group bacterium]
MNLKHYDHDGRVRYVTFCIHNKIPLLTNIQYRDIVETTINAVLKAHNVSLIAYVIMPEHVHLVVRPPLDAKLGYIIGEIKRQSSRLIHSILKTQDQRLLERLTIRRNKKRRFVLWQRRCFDHNCRSEESVWHKVDYCHNNPVRRGLVKNPGDWRWSSYWLYHEE